MPAAEKALNFNTRPYGNLREIFSRTYRIPWGMRTPSIPDAFISITAIFIV